MQCHFEQVTQSVSTNQDLMDRWRQHQLSAPVSLRAIEQTAGKGRRGNVWISQAQHSLTFSLAYPFDHHSTTLKSLQPLSLIVGMAILEGLAIYLKTPLPALRDLGLGLKWPNDLYLGPAKIGGVLIESGQKQPDQPIWAIIGVGINLQNIDSPITSNYPVGSLAQLPMVLPSSLDPEALWQTLSTHLLQTMAAFVADEHLLHTDDWNALHRFHAAEVEIIEEGQVTHRGTVHGVNAQGALLLATPIGIQTIHNGHLSMRKA